MYKTFLRKPYWDVMKQRLYVIWNLFLRSSYKTETNNTETLNKLNSRKFTVSMLS